MDNHQGRIASANHVLTAGKRLHAAISLYVTDPRFSLKARMAGLLKAAEYVESSEFSLHAPSCGKAVRAVRTELKSMSEYLVHCAANRVDPDYSLMTPVASGQLVAALQDNRVEVLKARNRETLVEQGMSIHADAHADLLRRNQRFASKVPSIDTKGFGFARVPLVFTTDQGKNKHAGIGWLDVDMLGRLGFNADVLDGYAVLHNQVVLGVDSLVAKQRSADPDDDQVHLTDLKIKDRTITFKGGKPTPVLKTRSATPRDFATEYCNLLSKKQGIEYAFVSDRAYGYKGGSWFWLMPERDLRRLARAFPGGHVKTSTWGFAF